MQLDNALFSFLQQQRDLITDHRPLRLRLSHSTQMFEDVLLPQRVYGTEAICGSLEYRILCVALDAHLPLKELIALPVAIDFVTDRGDLRSVCGIVTEAAAGDSDGGLASYQLVLRDALAILEKRTNTRVFRNKNEVEIVQLILDEWRQSNAILGTCFNYETDELFALRDYPRREFIMQYNESDAAFIRRLLKRRGIAWYFRADGATSPAHKLVLFNNAESIQPNAAGTVRYHRDNAIEERDSITAWCAVRTLQPGSVTLHSWDYKNPQGRHFMSTTATSGVDQGSSGNEMSASLDHYQVQAPHIGDDHEDLCQLGQLATNRHDYESKCFHGEGSVRDLCAGEYFTMIDHPEVDTHAESDRDFVVTSLQIAALNNLPKALADRVARLFSRNRWILGQSDAMEQASQGPMRTRIQFTAVRRGLEIVPAWESRTEQPQAPLQSAIVVGPEGEEVHCDELGRVKVRFASTRDKDHEHAQGAGASDSDPDSAWIRVATAWAGNGPGPQNQCGFLGLPRVGSEVLIAFVGGDPDKPVIVGQLYNQEGQPPALSGAGQLPGNRHLSGFRTREIAGGRKNQLRFDDTSGEISAQLASDHADSQLNLGYITSDKSDGSGTARGEGVELQSRASVAVRGEAGVLITASRRSASGKATLSREELLGAARLGQNVEAHLSEMGTKLAEDPAVKNDVRELVDAVDKWEIGGGAPVTALTASEGIIAATPKSIALAAQRSIHSNSGGDNHIGAGGSLFARAAKGVSVLACKLGVKLIAGGGDVKIQSQAGHIEITSSKKIKLIANEGIELHSPAIKLIAQGTQIDCGSGRITQQSSGVHTIKSSKFQHTSGGNGTPEKLDLPSIEVEHDQQVLVTDLKMDEPLRDRKYKITVEDGKTFEGTTDQSGLTERFSTKTAFARYVIELLD